jgi:hypothetical protein
MAWLAPLILLALTLALFPVHRSTRAQEEPTPGGLVVGPSPTPTPTPGGLVIGPSPTPGGLMIGPSPTADASPGPGVVGKTYTSPTYGFSLEWDESWEVVAATSDADEDRLHLSNATSEVTFRAHPGFGGDAVACLAAMVGALRDEPEVAEVGLAYGPDGQPLQEESASRSFAVYTYELIEGDLVTPAAVYFDCRTLIPASAVLELSHRTELSAFNAEAPKVEALLATLEIPTVPAPPTEPTPTAGAVGLDCTGVDAWLAATRPRIDRRVAIGEEGGRLVDPNQLLQAVVRWAEELTLLAQAQAATPAPPAAAQLNGDLAAHFQTEADLLNQVVDAVLSGDIAAIQRLDREMQEADVLFNRLRVRVDDLARECGLATG